MSELAIGRSIHQSVLIVENLGKEIEAFYRLATEGVAEKINQSINDMKIVTKWKYSSRSDDYDYVLKDRTASLGLSSKTGKKPKRYISIQVSLAGDGMSLDDEDNLLPLVHVCFWKEPVDLLEMYMGFDLQGNEDLLELKNEVFFHWKTESDHWSKAEWAYSLLLTSLNSPDDIKEKIVDPIIKIIGNKSEGSEILQGITGVVRYELSTDLQVKVKAFNGIENN